MKQVYILGGLLCLCSSFFTFILLPQGNDEDHPLSLKKHLYSPPIALEESAVLNSIEVPGYDDKYKQHETIVTIKRKVDVIVNEPKDKLNFNNYLPDNNCDGNALEEFSGKNTTNQERNFFSAMLNSFVKKDSYNRR